MGYIISAVIVAAAIVIIIYKNKKQSSQYDERQKEIRGNAYRYAFYTMVVYEVVMMFISMNEASFAQWNYICHIGGIVLSCTVLACYCIWNGAYWGIENDRKKGIIFFIFAALMNMIPVAISALKGTLYEDGKPGSAFINIIVLAMLLVVGAALIIRNRLDQQAKEE